MNTKRFFYVTEKFMRQVGSAFFVLLILSLFNAFMTVQAHAETYEYR